METYSFVTWGCKVNQYESQALRERFAARGLTEVAPEAGADLYVLNTCTVTESAAGDAQREARRIARRFPFAEIAVTGCAADTHREAFLDIPGVRRVVGHAEKAAMDVDSRLAPGDLEISRFDGHTRAFLKVEDGCDLNCSFCIIPMVRGTPRSRPLAKAVEEARRLVGHGHREIVLTGVHLGCYGKDLDGRPTLAALAERLLAIPGLARLRLSSIEANEISEPLLRLMAAEPRFCPHLHVPLQSGDDGVLRAMRRRYNAGQYLEAVERLAAAVPEPGLTTDVIVGFPGETEAAFEATLELCRRAGVHRIHAFPYSRRRGTEAASRPDLPHRVKKERRRRLERLGAELGTSYARRFVGREVEVLLEAEGAGYTERYVKARAPGARGAIVRMKVERIEDGELAGSVA